MNYQRTTNFNFILNLPYIINLRANEIISLSVFLDELVNQKQRAKIDLITFVEPSYFTRFNSAFHNLIKFMRVEKVDDTENHVKLDEYISEEPREELLGESDEAEQARYLITLANKVRADGIVTNNSLLLKCKDELYQYHRLKIYDHHGFYEILDIIAVGNEVYMSIGSDWKNVPLEVYYMRVHWKGSKWAKWYFNHYEEYHDKSLQEMFRSALLNRYAFVAYAHDMVLYGALQQDSYFRVGIKEGHSMLLNYHLTTFYLILWGMLEHVTSIVNLVVDLGLKRKECGIKSSKFLARLSERYQNHFDVYNAKYKKWVDVMADMRHAAAHHTLNLPAVLLEETEESKMSDQEIIAALKDEGIGIDYSDVEGLGEAFWQLRIYEWRRTRAKEIAPYATFVEKDKKSYWRSPIASIDFDFLRMNAVMDLFWSLIVAR